ncbi:MAG: hypothetical protein HZY76_12265 [Anaerolineae bacterium]|nr:MAG: hypothetical protein HZY76_12265 [Anaerolineae bacterium]
MIDYPTAAENARVQAVLDRLVAARLLVRGAADPSIGSGQAPNDAPGEAYVEPAHGALVLAWDRLLRWRKAAGEYLPLQRRLAQAANDWSRAAPEARPGLLWDNDPACRRSRRRCGRRAAARKAWLGGRAGAARPGAAHRQADRYRLAEQSRTDLCTGQRRSVPASGGAVGVALLLALVLIGATAISLSLRGALQAEATAVAEAQRGERAGHRGGRSDARSTQSRPRWPTSRPPGIRRAAPRRRTVRSRPGADRPRPRRALLIAQEAVSVTRTFESEEALRETLRGSQLRAAYAPEADWVDSVAYAPDGSRLLATGTHRGQPFAQVLELPTLTPTVRLSDLPGGYITGAVFSPDGQQILTSDDSGVVSLWDARTGLADPPFQGIAADWSADGQYFVVAVEDGTVDIRRTVDGRGARTFPGRDGDSAAAVYFAAGDRLIVLVTAADTGNDQQARVLDAATGDVLAEFPVNYDSLAFTADRMALAYGDGETVQVRSASDNFVQPVFSLPGHTADVTATRFSPDDRLVASTATDNTVRVWTLDAGQAAGTRFVARSTTLEQSAVRIAFSPLDGTLLAAGYGDVRGWDIANTRGCSPSITAAVRKSMPWRLHRTVAPLPPSARERTAVGVARVSTCSTVRERRSWRRTVAGWR